MARHALLAALVVLAAVIVGCEPAKELPDDIPKITEPTEPEIVVPAASEPAAKAYIEKAVKAYTGNKPELIAKGKTSRVVLKGKMLLPVETQKVESEASRAIVAAWPDRLQVVNEFELPTGKISVGTWVHRPHMTVLRGSTEVPVPNRAEAERNLIADAMGQLWMTFLIPPTDPKAIVFDFRAQTLPSQTGKMVSVQSLKLSLPDSPIFNLTFDTDTDALVYVEYTHTELGVRHTKQWNMTAHKVGPHGLLLPTKMECKQDNMKVEDWEVEKWEFPDKVNDDEFNPPRN